MNSRKVLPSMMMLMRGGGGGTAATIVKNKNNNNLFRFFHTTFAVRKSPRSREPEYFLHPKARACPLCFKKFKKGKFMLQHLFNPLSLKCNPQDLPEVLKLPLLKETVKKR